VRRRPVLRVARRYLDYLYADMVRRRLAAQVDCVDARDVELFLDLGCHVGYNTDRIRDVLAPAQTVGIELNTSAAREAYGRGIDVLRHDLNQPLPLGSDVVDVITAFDVLEHLTETWQIITEMYRVLKPDGFALIDCPNLAAWHNVLILMLGFQPSSGPHLISIADSDLALVEDMHREDHGLSAVEAEQVHTSKMHRHIVVPAFRSLKRVLIKAGFDIAGSWGFGYYPLPPRIANWFCRLDVSHAHHFLIKARKPSGAS